MHSSLDSRFDYFQKGVLRFFPPATLEEIGFAERQLDIKFSPHYKEFIQSYNGGQIIEVHLHGVQSADQRKISRGRDIVSINQENWANNWWPKTWLEVGTDGFGNYFVADIKSENVINEYPILLIDHETLEAEIDTLPYAANYLDLVFNVINEMSHLYTPDGYLKSNIHLQ